MVREFELPGLKLQPCKHLILVQDSRGATYIGLFAGYSGSFIALAHPDDCKNIMFFVNIKRINLIVVKGEVNAG